ncbi:MAG TPA: nitroreductase family protein [Bacteroidia bacterium]|nr:nitroreductase family protein [Bacteroidia bacterium]
MAHIKGFIPYAHNRVDNKEMLENSLSLLTKMNERRSLRFFSDQAVDFKVIENIVMTASSAPSGANKQPWTFCVVEDPTIKKAIREAAEKEEYEGYNGRMSERWLKDLEQFGTDWHKPFLETAPYLIIVFKQAYELDSNQEKHNNYYVNESVGIATGMLITAIHLAGLVTLTHTPSPMNFLSSILKRPENERPFLLLPVGYPADDAIVPELDKKNIKEVLIRY